MIGCARGESPRSGFTLVELLVLLGMGVVLVAVFVPYFSAIRESRGRLVCADNLRQISAALTQYAGDNRYMLPRVVYDVEKGPNSWTSFTGPDCADPFADDAVVRANDVTASLWLLVRGGYVKEPAVFVCPSTDDRADSMTDERGRPVGAGKRGNFRAPIHLSYSYANPFSAAAYRSTDRRASDFVVLADRNPGLSRGADVTSVRANFPPLERARGNSHNHGGAGQNVLYAIGTVEFVTTPFTGVRREGEKTGDNIYTALSARPLLNEAPAPTEPGFIGEDVGPAYEHDSYLVPYAR
jgi:type II secretory pathway pseudopilin PulG